jgi:hypothetical protein
MGRKTVTNIKYQFPISIKRSSYKQKHYIQTDLTQTEYENMDWVELAQEMAKFWISVNMRWPNCGFL